MAEKMNMDELKYHIVEINEGKALSMVKHLLTEGKDPLDIIGVCETGMKEVGLRYERKEYFISGLIMAGELFRQTMELVKPYINEKKEAQQRVGIIIQ